MSFKDKVWWTKKARIQTEKRLLRYDIYSQLMLLWYSIALVIVSIFELKSPLPESYFGSLMVALSVLVLCATLFVNNRNFKDRANLVKQCYETLSILIEDSKKNDADIALLDREYQKILGLCENHTDIDFKKAVVSEYYNTSPQYIDQLTKHPTRTQIVHVVCNNIIYYTTTSLLFIFPIAIYLGLRN